MESKVSIRKKTYSKREKKDAWFALILLLPTLIILVISIFIPIFQALKLSFTDATLLNIDMASTVGLENFYKLFKDPIFWEAFKNTIIFVVVCGVGGLSIGLALALFLNEAIPFRNFLRGIVLVPWVLPGVVIALLALYMLNKDAGVINYLLVHFGITDDPINWFGSTKYALWAEMAATIWNQTPFYMLMILAGLQTVPQEQYESAKIDGASIFRTFWHITLPNIKSVIIIATTLMIIWNFNTFDIIWPTTEGGPGSSTTTLSIYVYREAFKGLDIGFASAVGVIWLIFLLIFSSFYVRILRGR